MDSNIDQNPASRDLLAKIDPRDALRTLFVALCAVLLALGVTQPTKDFPATAVAGLIAGCFPIAVEAWGDIRHARMSMELSMLIAIVAAAAIGEWLGAQAGLGYFSRRMMTQLDGAGVFAPIVLLSVAAMLLTALARQIESRALRFRNHQDSDREETRRRDS